LSSKRVKISFGTVNEGKITVINKSSIAETNNRVKAAMKDVVRTYEKKESRSQQEAALLVLNA
jgi:hypothetical protein